MPTHSHTRITDNAAESQSEFRRVTRGLGEFMCHLHSRTSPLFIQKPLFSLRFYCHPRTASHDGSAQGRGRNDRRPDSRVQPHQTAVQNLSRLHEFNATSAIPTRHYDRYESPLTRFERQYTVDDRAGGTKCADGPSC